MVAGVRMLGVQIANGFSPEARVFADLLAHTDRSDLDAHVLVHKWPGDTQSAARFGAVSGASIYPFDFGWRSMASSRRLWEKVAARMRFIASLPRAVATARRVDPDLIYSCQQLWDCQAATYIARRLRKPQVIHLHCVVGPWLHQAVLRRLERCDHLIAVSDYVRGEAIQFGVPGERVSVVRNSMADRSEYSVRDGQVRRELGIPNGVPLLGIIARLDPSKGQADTLAAFSRLLKHHPDAKLLIVGDENPWSPGYERQLRENTAQLQLEDAVRFMGYRSDVPRILSALDIFVHPSRQEGCGLSLLEASAAALPIVAYAEGGPCEIIKDGVTGHLAATGSIDDLANKLTLLLNNPDRAREMGRAGRERTLQEFSPRNSAKRFSFALKQFGTGADGSRTTPDSASRELSEQYLSEVAAK